MTKNVSAERSLAGSVLISVLVAAIASRSRVLAFDSFATMALILIAGNLVVYVLTKVGLFKSSGD